MIVGFTGRRRSGKDTAATALRDLDYTRLSFAGPLKEMLITLLSVQGLSRTAAYNLVEGADKETPTHLLNGRSPRYAMQTLGTEWGRDLIDVNLWVRAALRSAADDDKVMFTDVRFPNEVKAIHDAGGIVIKIVRPTPLASDDTHPSEILIDSLDVDAVVINEGSIEQLHARVLARLKELRP